LTLQRTDPPADSVVSEAPDEVRLFFSEPPQMRGTTVRVADASNELVAATDAAPDGEDPKQVFVRPAAPLEPGTYTVHWRVIAQDGHAQRGEFSFQVATE
jgi:copper resistance protein C